MYDGRNSPTGLSRFAQQVPPVAPRSGAAAGRHGAGACLQPQHAGQFADERLRLQAAQARHADVEQHQVELALRQAVERRLAVADQQENQRKTPSRGRRWKVLHCSVVETAGIEPSEFERSCAFQGYGCH